MEEMDEGSDDGEGVGDNDGNEVGSEDEGREVLRENDGLYDGGGKGVR